MDSGWLAILKASGWQLVGLSLALLVYWLFLQFGILPPTDSPLVVYGLPLAMLITGGLGSASLLEQIVAWAKQIIHERRKERERVQRVVKHQKQFTEHIPYLTKAERSIFGWLLKNNEKSFSAEMDCGNGSSLLKRGYIQSDAMHGIAYGLWEFPFSIPDHIWVVLEENKEQFPTEFKEPGLPWFRRHL